MAADQTTFRTGDHVRHPARPEWGIGSVRLAQPVFHEGRSAQRLTVDFANKGRVVINTAVVALEGKGQDSPMTTLRTTEKSSGSGWLDALERSQGGGNELWSLQPAMTDPFASLPQRLRATLDSFRFSTQPRALMEWATIQTGLNDPLTKYTRQELEQAFARFARDRTNHMFDLARQIRRSSATGLQTLRQIARETTIPAARAELEKALRG